jgi:hypothetical protein
MESVSLDRILEIKYINTNKQYNLKLMDGKIKKKRRNNKNYYLIRFYEFK